MSRHDHVIKIVRYTDDDGNPTCCTNWETDRCGFLGVRRMGTIEVCMATGLDLYRSPAQQKDLLRPAIGCPVWEGTK